MLDGVNGIADYQCRQILDQRYHRLAPTFPPDIEVAMDDVDRIPWLVEFAEGLDIAHAAEWIRTMW